MQLLNLFPRFLLVIGISIWLAACGGGGGGDGGGGDPVATNGNADLSELTLSVGTLDQLFQSNQMSYTMTVPFAVDSLQLTPTLADSGASVTVEAVVVNSGQVSGNLPLVVGNNSITLVINAADGSTQSYTIVITRGVKVNPVVTTTTPLKNANGAAILGNITATLSDTIDPATVTTSSFTVSLLDGTPVNGAVSVLGQQVIFNPHGALQYATDYRVTLTTAITDTDSAPLAIDHQWLFNSGSKLTEARLHTCARFDNGTVKCWGINGSGQLGLGDTLARGGGGGEMGEALPAVDLGDGRTALSLTAGGFHTCALLDNGTVKCWGDNTAGQLGIGDRTARGDAGGEMGEALLAVNLGNGRTALSLTAGDLHTCALLDNGTVKCWGQNFYGQLGLGDTMDRGDAVGEMGEALPAVDFGNGRTALSLTAGDAHTCARLDNSTVKCWGQNSSGQLGLGH